MSQENVALVRRVVEPWPRGDFSAWLAAFAPDIVMSGYTPEGVVTTHGRDQVLRYISDFASQWSRYSVEVDDVLALSDDAVLVVGRQHGTGRDSGAELSLDVFVVNCLRDGEIVATRWRADRGDALEAVGLSE